MMKNVLVMSSINKIIINIWQKKVSHTTTTTHFWNHMESIGIEKITKHLLNIVAEISKHWQKTFLWHLFGIPVAFIWHPRGIYLAVASHRRVKQKH